MPCDRPLVRQRLAVREDLLDDHVERLEAIALAGARSASTSPEQRGIAMVQSAAILGVRFRTHSSPVAGAERSSLEVAEVAGRVPEAVRVVDPQARRLRRSPINSSRSAVRRREDRRILLPDRGQLVDRRRSGGS